MPKKTGKLIKWAFSYWKEIVSLAFVLAITVATVYFIIFGVFAGWKYLDKKISGNYEYSLNYGLTVVVYDSKVKIKSKETGKTVGSYDKIFRPEDASQRALVVVRNGKRGYISAVTGAVIVDPRYMRAWIADRKTGLAACVNDSCKLGFININTGETAIPFQFDYSCVYMLPHPQYYVFNNGVCPVPGKSDEDCSHAGYGLIDVTGKLLLPCEYDDINSYGDTLFKVMRDDKYGIC
ncbi:MAG: WG repeat-containing protein, partial [Bacteroidales bacterium]|nr:WG repeat-containing protein [Bacteroidales bacterium]